MADRFDEMAEKVLLYSNIAFTSDAQIHEFRLSIATALRELAAAEREAGAADMRERAAHAAAICRSTLPADAGPLQTAEIVQGDIVRHIHDLALTTPKET